MLTYPQFICGHIGKATVEECGRTMKTRFCQKCSIAINNEICPECLNEEEEEEDDDETKMALEEFDMCNSIEDKDYRDQLYQINKSLLSLNHIENGEVYMGGGHIHHDVMDKEGNRKGKINSNITGYNGKFRDYFLTSNDSNNEKKEDANITCHNNGSPFIISDHSSDESSAETPPALDWELSDYFSKSKDREGNKTYKNHYHDKRKHGFLKREHQEEPNKENNNNYCYKKEEEGEEDSENIFTLTFGRGSPSLPRTEVQPTQAVSFVTAMGSISTAPSKSFLKEGQDRMNINLSMDIGTKDISMSPVTEAAAASVAEAAEEHELYPNNNNTRLCFHERRKIRKERDEEDNADEEIYSKLPFSVRRHFL